MSLEIIIEDARWNDVDLSGIADRAVRQALEHLGLDPDRCELSLLGCDDTEIAKLNAAHRDKPDATNVLSWPDTDLAATLPGHDPAPPQPDFTGEIALGDIAIAFDTCLREAGAAGKPVGDHVAHLVVHGLLHLLGYDHIRDPDATLMEQIETEILGRMGLDTPYCDTDGV